MVTKAGKLAKCRTYSETSHGDLRSLVSERIGNLDLELRVFVKGADNLAEELEEGEEVPDAVLNASQGKRQPG